MNNMLRRNDSIQFQPYQEHFLFIDSRFRTQGESNVDYVASFNSNPDAANETGSISHGVFRNVKSIELKGVSIRNIPDEPYVILNIKECENRLHANYSMADDTFAVIYFDSVPENTLENDETDLIQNTHIKPIKGSDMDQKIIEFNPPLASLSRLSIKFLTNKRGDNNPNLTYLQDYEHLYNNTLLFKIITQVRN